MPQPTPKVLRPSSKHATVISPCHSPSVLLSIPARPYQLVRRRRGPGVFPKSFPAHPDAGRHPFGTQGKRGRKVALPTKKKRRYLGFVDPNQGNEAKRARAGGDHRRPESERAKESIKSELVSYAKDPPKRVMYPRNHVDAANVDSR